MLSVILDIAIVLAATYITLSCFVSWVHEQIAAGLNLRGKMLYRGVLNLVFGHQDLTDALFRHPMISGTTSAAGGKPITQTAPTNGSALDARAPSYIDARAFSLAFWQVFHASQAGGEATGKPGVPPAPATVSGAAASDNAWDIASKAVSVPTVAIADLQKAVDALSGVPAVADKLDAILAQAGSTAKAIGIPTGLIVDLQQYVAYLDRAPELRQTLTALLTEAGNDYDALLAATDGWFNAQMDRVSGWYKRNTQLWIVALSLLVVAFTGVDSVAIARGLALHPAAAEAAANCAGNLTTMNPAGQRTPAPAAAGTAGAAPSAGASAAGAGNGNDCFDIAPYTHVTWNPLENWGKRSDGHVAWPGMLFTVAALSLGSPFWFDVLGGLVNVRNAGRKPKRTDQPPR